MIKYINILTLFLVFHIACTSGPMIGPTGPIGPKGKQGIQGQKGAQGIPGEGFTKKKINYLEKLISENKLLSNEIIVANTSYSFGFAPKKTGFVYLTNKGRLFKLENKNPQTLGQNIEYFSSINKKGEFISLTKTASVEDIKQYFTAATKNGDIFSSENLEDWKWINTINFKK